MSTPAVHHLVPARELDLTPRQRLFCARIAGGASGAEAARQAGYSHATAAQQASRMLRKPEVRAEVDRLLADQFHVQQAALDRMLSKVEEVYRHAVRQRQCAAALRAIEVEAALRQNGAKSLPADVSPVDLGQEPNESEPIDEASRL